MNKVNQWEKELEILHRIFQKTNLKETIKWGAPVFTHHGKNIASFGGFKNYFTVWFYQGVFLSDPFNVLVNAQEGKTKALRQWRFYSATEIDEQKILLYLNESIQNSEEGKEIKPEKFQAVNIPVELENELKKDKKLVTEFQKLTPGKQKEFSLFIEEAKQEKIKFARLEKIIPLIQKGVGLHDGYKK